MKYRKKQKAIQKTYSAYNILSYFCLLNVWTASYLAVTQSDNKLSPNL